MRFLLAQVEDIVLNRLNVTEAWQLSNTTTNVQHSASLLGASTTVYYQLELSRVPVVRNSTQKLKLLRIDVQHL
eukprot:m.15674 g.15674  ORF g.15674 m.15674 type:complete len:74 (-) comp10794_c0_seq2:699-920(-)